LSTENPETGTSEGEKEVVPGCHAKAAIGHVDRLMAMDRDKMEEWWIKTFGR
jgi:hypothetical protein